jgi:hypothetical protein
MSESNNDKKEYVIRTLSRTKRKDYENYVVNRLYLELDDLDIKPMSQKYVKLKGEKSYRLIDLYFPQFNIGIEVDESHHLSQKEEDRLRTEDIISSLAGYDEKRIEIKDKTLIEINKEISEKVKYIKDKKEQTIANGTFLKWEIVDSKEYFKTKAKITIDDDITFNTITEASNAIFETKYTMQQQAYYRIPTIKEEKIMAWFPKLAIEKEGITVAASRGWNNTLNDDKDIIIEYHEKGINADKKMDGLTRVTFMKIKDPITRSDGYKFLGIFKPIDKTDGIVTYKRVATEFKIIKNK